MHSVQTKYSLRVEVTHRRLLFGMHLRVFGAPTQATPCLQAAAKRFHVTGSGKVMVRRAGKQHKNAKLTISRSNRLKCVRLCRVGVFGLRPTCCHSPWRGCSLRLVALHACAIITALSMLLYLLQEKKKSWTCRHGPRSPIASLCKPELAGPASIHRLPAAAAPVLPPRYLI